MSESKNQSTIQPEIPSPDALDPWQNVGLPPTTGWGPDVLGEPFQARTIPLEDDEEGPNEAVLVRMRAPKKHRRKKAKPKFALLYIHGRNDYFFQVEAAQNFQDMGAAFYALDLRKYGRALRPWQTIGYADDLSVYDQDLSAAADIIAEEHPDLPLVVFAHSTGGLIATLWAWKNPDRIAALILNAAWLELQSLTGLRPTLEKVLRGLAGLNPRATVIGESKVNYYARSITEGWAGAEFAAPEEMRGDLEDPAMVGWSVIEEWKKPFSYPAPAAWLGAILEGHRLVQDEVQLSCPVLSLASSKGAPDDVWSPVVFEADIVLDPDLVSRRAATLSSDVTIARLPGKHDLLLSDPQVRADLYTLVDRWLRYALPQ